MANRHDYYFKQPVTESELNDGFAELEDADHAIMLDQVLVGLFSGGSAAQHAGVANLTIDLGTPIIGYDNSGQRIFVAGSNPLNVNCAQDSQSVNTAVSGVGNEKWLSIEIQFARTLSDPRVDGNSNTVYFDSNESYTIVVTQGAEAPVGTGVRPTLDPNALLICDVQLTHGMTQILNANISTTRRQDVFVMAGTPFSIRAGTLTGAVQAMLTNLNNHVLNLSGAHPATAIAFTPANSSFADATQLASTNVQAAIDEIVTDLASTGSGNSGGRRVGFQHTGSAFFVDATSLTSTDVTHAIEEIVSKLGSSTLGSSGASRIGVDSTTGVNGIFNLPSGSIANALHTVAAALDRSISIVGINGYYSGAATDNVTSSAGTGVAKISGIPVSVNLPAAQAGDIVLTFAMVSYSCQGNGSGGPGAANFAMVVTDGIGVATTVTDAAMHLSDNNGNPNTGNLLAWGITPGPAGQLSPNGTFTSGASKIAFGLNTLANSGIPSVSLHASYSGSSGGSLIAGQIGGGFFFACMLLRPNINA